MTEIAGATSTYDMSASNREDLWDVISNISPMDRPFTQNIERIRAKATRHDWLTDSLNSASSNKQLEGDVTSFSTAVAITKLSNTCQIMKKAFVVTGTQEAVDKAGRRSEIKYQLQKAGNELLRDLEWTALSAQVGSAGSQTVARAMAGAEAWIPSTDNSGNGVRGGAADSSGSTAAYTSPGGGAVADGTNTTLSSTGLLTALGLAWTDGGDVDTIMTNTFQRSRIKGFGNLATNQIQLNKSGEAAKIVDSVEVYLSDYGKHKLVLNRHLRPETVMCFQMDKWALAELRPMFTETLAKTGDGESRHIIWEGTLVCRNPDASAKISDCTTV
jgi:hypothetical protein